MFRHTFTVLTATCGLLAAALPAQAQFSLPHVHLPTPGVKAPQFKPPQLPKTPRLPNVGPVHPKPIKFPGAKEGLDKFRPHWQKLPAHPFGRHPKVNVHVPPAPKVNLPKVPLPKNSSGGQSSGQSGTGASNGDSSGDGGGRTEVGSSGESLRSSQTANVGKGPLSGSKPAHPAQSQPGR
jgi:hypothetical protein